MPTFSITFCYREGITIEHIFFSDFMHSCEIKEENSSLIELRRLVHSMFYKASNKTSIYSWEMLELHDIVKMKY